MSEKIRQCMNKAVKYYKIRIRMNGLLFPATIENQAGLTTVSPIDN
jgi:hypothetical protein